MIALVVVHMNGCPYCVEVTGEDSLAKSVSDLVPVYEVERSDPLAEKLHAKSFPTILLSTPLVTFRFEGQRSRSSLRRFVLQCLGQYHILQRLLAKTGRPSPVTGSTQ